jgi:chromosome segregation ATPase
MEAVEGLGLVPHETVGEDESPGEVVWVDALVGTCRARAEAVSRLEADLVHCRAEVERLGGAAGDAAEHGDAAELTHARNRCSELEREVGAARKAVDRARELEERLGRWEADLEAGRDPEARNAELAAAVDALKEDHRAESGQWDAALREATARAEAAEGRADTAERSLEETVGRAEAAEGRLLEAMARADSAEAQAVRGQHELTTLHDRCREMESAFEASRHGGSQADGGTADPVRFGNGLDQPAPVADEGGQPGPWEAERQDLIDRLEVSLGRQRAAEAEIARLSELAEDLRASRDGLEAARAALAAEADAVRGAEREAADRARELEEPLARWEADLEASRAAARAEADRRARDLEARNAELAAAVDALKAQTTQLRQEVARAQHATLGRKDQDEILHLDTALGEWE